MNFMVKEPGLARSTIDVPYQIKAIEDSGEFEGYASVFGNVDSYGDVVEAGAFDRTLEEWAEMGQLPPVLWQHSRNEPIGKHTEMKPDEHGLATKGKLIVDDVTKAREARALAKEGVVTGLSIGYTFYSGKGFEWDDEANVYRLLEIKLIEVSFVTFPANSEARIGDIKATIQSGHTPRSRDIERALRDMFGVGRRKARRMMSEGVMSALKNEHVDDSDVDDDQAELLEELEKLRRRITA